MSKLRPSDPSPRRPGELVHTADQGHVPMWPGTACRHRGPSDPSGNRLGVLVDIAGPGTRAQVARGRWSTPRALEPERESPGCAGPPRGHSDPSTSHPGELVDHAGLRTIARVPRDIWSTPRDLGPQRELPRRAGRHRGPSDMGPSRPGQLVVCAGSGSQARLLQDIYSSPWANYSSASPPVVLLVHAGSWNRVESPTAADHHRGLRHTGLSYLGQLVDPAAIVPEPESPGTAGRHHGPVTGAPVARDCLSTPRAIGPSVSRLGVLVDIADPGTRPKSPGAAGRPRVPLNPRASCPDVRIHPACPWTRARVA